MTSARISAAARMCRWYPLLRGRWRLASLLITGSPKRWEESASAVVKELPQGEVIRCRGDVRIRIRRAGMYVDPYLFGDYEAAHSRVVRRVVHPGDVAFDVGSNFGWFTALLAELVGPGGEIHAFEPIPELAALAAETVELNDVSSRVRLNTLALSSFKGPVTIHTFAGLPHSHASHADLGRSDAQPHECERTTLDHYVRERGLSRIDFMKIDAEGHELEIFRGGESVFRESDAPVVSFEINRLCLDSHGVGPEDLQELLTGYGYTDFWLLSRTESLRRVRRLADDDDGTYLTVKPWLRERRLRARGLPRLTW